MSKDHSLPELRHRAERLIHDCNIKVIDDTLFHELQVYHVELEMQNDELKLSYEQLEQEKEKFARLFNLAPVGYFILTNAALITQCNEAGLEMLEIERTRITGRRFQQFIQDESLPVFHKFLYSLYANTNRETCELKLRTITGKTVIVQLCGVSIFSPRSQSSYFISAIDITQKHAIEQKKKEVAERLEAALSTSDMGTIIINLEEDEANLDQHAMQVLELDAAHHFDGKYSSFLKLIHPRDVQRINDHVKALFDKKAPLNVEFKTKNANMKILQMRGNLCSAQANFIGVLSDITPYRLLELQAEELKSGEQKKIMQAIVDAQEKEKVRISHSLHDGLAQLLYAAQINLDYCTENVKNEHIKKIKNLLTQAIQEARNISYELAPSLLTDHGLQVSIQELLNRIQLPHLSIRFSAMGLDRRLKLSSEVFVFRIVQELLNNILKHSQANTATIKLKYMGTKLRIQIADNGKGMNAEERTRSSGGLASVLNRVKLVDGAFNIYSSSLGGTKIDIIIPKID